MRVYKCDRCGKGLIRLNGSLLFTQGWKMRNIDRDELLKVADECERADVDGVTDWAERIRKAVVE